MKIELIVKTGKGKKSTRAEIDKTCDVVEYIMNSLIKKRVITDFTDFKALQDGACITLK
jgi:hypothetical protein